MSKSDPPNGRGAGYGRPPVEHRFKKGISGNPKGRPRKKRDQEPLDPFKVSSQRANQIFLQEAYRKYPIGDGQKTVGLPAIQAIFRSLNLSAIKGDKRAARMIAEHIQQIENSDRLSRVEYMTTMLEHKANWERAIARQVELGLPPDEPVPHPGDIIIDLLNNDATINGPSTPEQKAAWDELLSHRDRIQANVSKTAASYKRVRGFNRAAHLEAWLREQLHYDKVNDDLPQRYRKELSDRCWEGGASMPGSQRTQFWPGED